MRLPGAVPILALLVAGCSELSHGEGQISQRIGQVTRNPEARELALPELTSFGWQSLRIFEAGTTRAQICQAIDAKPQHCDRAIRYLEVPADHLALLFSQNGRLTHTELHPVANGIFELPVQTQALPREKAVFTIRRTAGGPGPERVVLQPR